MKMKSTSDKPIANAAAMREALVYLVENENTLFEANLSLGELELLHLIVNKARAALAKPPHEAKWTANGGYEFACCSNCGHLQYAEWDSRAEQAEKIGDFHEGYKFCPNCGAQM